MAHSQQKRGRAPEVPTVLEQLAKVNLRMVDLFLAALPENVILMSNTCCLRALCLTTAPMVRQLGVVTQAMADLQVFNEEQRLSLKSSVSVVNRVVDLLRWLVAPRLSATAPVDTSQLASWMEALSKLQTYLPEQAKALAANHIEMPIHQWRQARRVL